MLDDFRLKVFEAVASEGSFTRAARRLGVTQSAVSQSVAELERQLGVQLFNRGRGSVTLTSSGVSFREYAEHILYWYRAAGDAFCLSGSALRKEIIISASEDLAVSVVPYMLSPFIGGDSTYSFRVVSGTCGTEADLYLSACISGTGRYGDEGWEKAGMSPLCAVGLPSDRNVYSGVSSISQVSSRLAVWTGDTESLSGNDIHAVRRRIAGLENESRVVFTSCSASAVAGMVESSSGVTGIVPLYSVYEKLADRKLSRLPLISPPGYADIYVKPSGSFSVTDLYHVMRQRLSDFLKQ